MDTKKVQICVLSKEAELYSLLLLQTNLKRGSFWQNVTGKVEAGEDFLTAAKRELEEETGFSGELQTLKNSFRFRDNWGRQVEERCYYILLPSCQKPKLDVSEHQNFEWVKAEKVSEEYFKFESNFNCFKEAMETCS